MDHITKHGPKAYRNDEKRPANVRIDIELEENWSLTKKEAWFEAALASGLDKKKDVNGEKGAMAGHLQRCEFVTVKEKGIVAQAAPVKKEKEQGEKGKCKQTEEGAEADDKGAEGSGGRTLRTMANITGRYFGGIWLLMYLTYNCNILAQYILNIPAWYMLGIL
ncbi:hypothetical protein C8J57DRAFT_1248068 [Mycena rebaudengoi]|nr:hypothetical protein C8J57DRAFT_1248068 [Mycena rebaudengoi]